MGKTKYNRFISIFIVLAIVLVVGCSENTTTSAPPLSFNILSPVNGAILESNIVEIAGQVSPVTASVQVDGLKTDVSEDGSFYTHIDLAEGSNVIDILVKLGEEKISRKIELTFTKPLVLFLDEPKPVSGLDYTKNPVTLTGSVTYPQAKVTINDTDVSVKPDGSYTAAVQLKTGPNIIKLKAESVGKQDVFNYVIDVDSFGKLTYPPPLMNGKSMLFLGNFNVKTGETVSTDVSLKVGRDIRVPARYNQKISFANAFSSVVPAPDGSSAVIQPDSFMIYPGVQYNMKLTIRISREAAPGTFYLKFENFLNDEKWMENDSQLSVNQ
jgi:hypothetical protein